MHISYTLSILTTRSIPSSNNLTLVHSCFYKSFLNHICLIHIIRQPTHNTRIYTCRATCISLLMGKLMLYHRVWGELRRILMDLSECEYVCWFESFSLFNSIHCLLGSFFFILTLNSHVRQHHAMRWEKQNIIIKNKTNVKIFTSRVMKHWRSDTVYIYVSLQTRSEGNTPLPSARISSNSTWCVKKKQKKKKWNRCQIDLTIESLFFIHVKYIK